MGSTEATARSVSGKSSFIWYVCGRHGRNTVIVSERDIDRFREMGYMIDYAFYRRKKYKDVFRDNGGNVVLVGFEE